MGAAHLQFGEAYTPEPNSGCWIWLHAVRGNGYGSTTVDGEKTGAHRWSWLLHKGEVPVGLHVLHRCDTPLCVNPRHLFLGTHHDNMIDRGQKKRGNYKHGLSGDPDYHADYKREWRAMRRAKGLPVT